jgi:dihydroorotate dehydrogenase
MVGVGGIHSGETAWEKIRAGATLIQVYSSLVYEGPALVGRVLDHFAERMTREGFGSPAQVTGTGVEEWAARDPNG